MIYLFKKMIVRDFAHTLFRLINLEIYRHLKTYLQFFMNYKIVQNRPNIPEDEIKNFSQNIVP